MRTGNPIFILYANEQFPSEFPRLFAASSWDISYYFPRLCREWLWPSPYPSHWFAIHYPDSSQTLPPSSQTYPSLYGDWLWSPSYSPHGFPIQPSHYLDRLQTLPTSSKHLILTFSNTFPTLPQLLPTASS